MTHHRDDDHDGFGGVHRDLGSALEVATVTGNVPDGFVATLTVAVSPGRRRARRGARPSAEWAVPNRLDSGRPVAFRDGAAARSTAPAGP